MASICISPLPCSLLSHPFPTVFNVTNHPLNFLETHLRINVFGDLVLDNETNLYFSNSFHLGIIETFNTVTNINVYSCKV